MPDAMMTIWPRLVAAVILAWLIPAVPATPAAHGAAPSSPPGGAENPASSAALATDLNVSVGTLARAAPRGDFPRYFSGEQSYFTVVGGDGARREGLLNEDGALEVERGAFSIEPFLYIHGKLVAWNEARPTQSLERGYLPLPSVTWRAGAVRLKITAFAGGPGGETLYARYRVDNLGRRRAAVKLFLAIRPFQVNPPWQSLNLRGGVAPIHHLRAEGRAVRVDGEARVVPLAAADRFGALGFGGSSLIDALRRGRVPPATEVHDPDGLAAGALEYRLDLAPGAVREIFLALPPWQPASGSGLAAAREESARASGPARWRAAVAGWEARQPRARLFGPPAARRLFDAVRSNLGYLLVHRDGPALYPGSRTYARSWIRDGSLMVSALLGMGYSREARDFIRWYAGFQFPDGKIPCCVDGRGADPTPENDSQGEFIYAVAEYARFTGDLGWVRALWPAVTRTVEYIEHLRRQRLTDAYRSGEARLFFGLMPDSISHEGYSAHPVHSFWDDFWTLRGLKDAAALAENLGDADRAQRFRALRDGFRADLYAALRGTMARHGIGTLPGSVELGDFDATATAMIVNTGGEERELPPRALANTFDEYGEYARKRSAGQLDWDAYTPYEIRNVEALVRLDRREQALDLLDFLLQGQRPPGWRQWAEVVWRDPRAPKFIGDMPHAWIGAEFARAARTLYAYEREWDGALVLAAGLPETWLAGGAEVGVRALPTWFGLLSYRLRRDGPDRLRLDLFGAMAMPPGGIVVKPPERRPITGLTVNGRPSGAFTASEARVEEFPATVIIGYGPAPSTMFP